jgi:siroheme synthase (precorrin-2 oxidase/ferrochelatase)
VAEARRIGALANRADNDEDGGDFTTPAVMRQGPVIVAVTAGAPALAAFIRDGLEQGWQENWTELAEAVRVLRPMILAAGLPPKRRQEIMRDLSGEAGMQRLADGGIDALRKWIEERMRHAQ